MEELAIANQVALTVTMAARLISELFVQTKNERLS